MALGTIEVGCAANGFWVSLEPRFQVLDAPGLFDDVLHGYRMLNDPAIRSRLATFGADKGVEILTPGHLQPVDAADPQGRPLGRRLPGAEDPHPGRRADPGRAAQEGRRPAGIAAARRGAAGDAEPAPSTAWWRAAAPFVAFKYYDIAKPMTYLPATLFAAPVVANRRFMKSLGPGARSDRARGIPQGGGRCSRTGTSPTSSAPRKIWRKNGGEIITLPPAEAKRYVDLVTPVTTTLLSANPRVKEDYEALLAAAKKYRQ